MKLRISIDLSSAEDGIEFMKAYKYLLDKKEVELDEIEKEMVK